MFGIESTLFAVIELRRTIFPELKRDNVPLHQHECPKQESGGGMYPAGANSTAGVARWSSVVW